MNFAAQKFELAFEPFTTPSGLLSFVNDNGIRPEQIVEIDGSDLYYWKTTEAQ